MTIQPLNSGASRTPEITAGTSQTPYPWPLLAPAKVGGRVPPSHCSRVRPLANRIGVRLLTRRQRNARGSDQAEGRRSRFLGLWAGFNPLSRGTLTSCCRSSQRPGKGRHAAVRSEPDRCRSPSPTFHDASTVKPRSRSISAIALSISASWIDLPWRATAASEVGKYFAVQSWPRRVYTLARPPCNTI
jgi:hypothetical protein